MKKIIILVFTLFSLSLFAEMAKEIRIGVVYDGKSKEKDYVESLMKKEIKNIVGTDYKIYFPEEKQLVDSFDKSNISKNLDILLNDESIDIVVAGGMLSSFISLRKKDIKKPLFAPFIHMDLKEINNVKEKNINFLVSSIDLKKEFDMMQRIHEFSNLKILVGKEMLETVPNLFEDFKEKFEKCKLNFEYEFVIVGKDFKEIFSELEEADAISVGPMNSISELEKAEIYNYINNRKIPLYSILGTVDVKDGLLAGFSYEKDTKKRIRTLAINISRYLSGEKMEDLNREVSESKAELLLNMEVIEKTNIWPDWDIISEAKMVNFVNENKNGMNLLEVIDIALKKNSQLQALRESSKNAELDRKNAIALFRPNISFEMTGIHMDETRAKSAMVPFAEDTLDAEVKLRQIIFNDDINLGKSISTEYMNIRNEELIKAEKDLILEVSEAYFTVLKAQAYANIERNSLELTKENLNIAKSRKKAGISGSADIYRWESERANDVSGLIESMIGVTLAKTNLKRVMNYNLIGNIEIAQMTHRNKEFITSDRDMMRYIENRTDLDILINYLVEIAYENSSDLKNLENIIKIEKAQYKNRKRKRYMPTIAMEASYKLDDLIKEGEGKNNADPSDDDQEWSVGINFSLPLYSGGEIKNNSEMSENTIKSYMHQKTALKKGIEQKVIYYSSSLVADFAKIKNANISSEAAHKALDLVSDSYFKGVVSIAELMDAQTAVISSDQYKETVIYDFLISLMRTERAAGTYFFRMEKTKRDELLEELTDL